ncbi:MAG TPA: phosphate acyltransferase [Oceanipulchritudo sp.]|nr:phosphate acyltransferase [Oceanipulchritudo sp.]
MSLLESLQGKLQRHPKRIVFPEGADPRIIQTARQFATRRCGVPVLLGDRAEIKERASRLDIRLDGIRIMEPSRSDDMDLFLPMLESLPAYAKLPLSEKKEILLNRHNFAALMLTTGRVDALLGGATVTTSSGLRSLFRIVPTQPTVKTASSMLVLDQENTAFGSNGLVFLADCGVIPEPSAAQLADIAVSTAGIAAHLTHDLPRVAFLSFASHSTRPAHASIRKIRDAIPIAEAKAAARGLAVHFEGELQLDAALDPVVAEQKGLLGSEVAGRANILVFPDLNSGNIASKMLQVVAGARTYGQIIIGLEKPCAEISRGAHVYDVFGTAMITASQAIDRNLLFGGGNLSSPSAE